MNLAHMQETRANKINELRGATDNPETFDRLEGEIRALDKDIKRAATLAEFERHAENTDKTFEAETRDYSVSKAIREAANGSLTGLERETHDELSKGREVRGVMIPTHLLLGETRAQTVTPASAGGHTVATNLGGMIDRLRPQLKTQGMGATVISGLTGNLDLPRLTGGPSAAWVAEDGSATETSSTFDKVSMSPKTVAGEMYLSRRLVLQNSVALEDVLRRDLGYVLAQALDSAAIQGGGANEPSGILDQIVQHGTTETEITDIAADLISALETDDVMGSAAFLTHPGLIGVARKIKEATGSNLNVPVAATFHQQRVETTTQVPVTSGPAYPLIYGHWADLLIGYWSGVDILANPYTDASKGGLRLHAFLDADIAIRHDESFAWKSVG